MKKLVKAMAIASNTIIMIILFFIIVEVFFRGLFGKPIKGVVEISGSLMVPMYFLGVAYVQMKKEHIRVDSISNKLSPRLAELHNMFVSLIMLILFSIIGYYGLGMAIHSFQTGEFEFTVAFWPIWVIRAFVPIGALLVDMLVITEFVEQIRKFFKTTHNDPVIISAKE